MEKDITKKPIYKISCEYYIYANDKDEAIDFIANEDNLVESHFIIEKVNKADVDEGDIYNNPKEQNKRKKLIEKLAYEWREAENYYLKTGKDIKKWKVKEKQDKYNLTDKELEELYSICNSMGV